MDAPILRTYHAEHCSKLGVVLTRVSGKPGIHTREQVAATLFDQNPGLRECVTGYGTLGASFDIRWIKRGG